MSRWPAWVKAALPVLLIVMLSGAAALPLLTTQAQGGGTIGYGTKVLGRIPADVAEVIYSFSGTAGDLVQVQVRNWAGTLDPQVTLLAPDGTTAGSGARSDFAAVRSDAALARYLADTGVYILLVTAENTTYGQFLLSLQGRGTVSATTLAYGESRDVAIPMDPQPQYFILETADCPTVLTIANLSAGRPFTFPYMVKVREPQGALIAVLYGGDAVEDRLILPAQSGRYEIEVSSEDPQQQGTVRLLATCGDGAPGCVGGGTSESAVAGTDAPAACPPCISEDFGGELCDDFAITAIEEEPGTFLFTWPAVDGAAYYIFSMTDAWGALLADSARLLEGETTHRYTLQMADYDRGPFTAYVTAGRAGDAPALLCSDEADVMSEAPPVDGCSTFAVSVDAVPGDERRAVVSWSALPGAGAFTIHVYAYDDDGGLIGIRVLTVPGDAMTYHLDGVFPREYTRFQIGVRAYSEASGGGAFGDMPQDFLCGGDVDVEFAASGPVEWGPAS